MSGDTVTAEVTVTNDGDVAGKDVVQLYMTAPYTNGGIEKPHVQLIGFDKTDELAPGASETATSRSRSRNWPATTTRTRRLGSSKRATTSSS